MQPTAPRGRKITRLSVSPTSSLGRRKSRSRARRSRPGAPPPSRDAVSAFDPSSWLSLDPHDLSQCDTAALSVEVSQLTPSSRRSEQNLLSRLGELPY